MEELFLIDIGDSVICKAIEQFVKNFDGEIVVFDVVFKQELDNGDDLFMELMVEFGQ